MPPHSTACAASRVAHGRCGARGASGRRSRSFLRPARRRHADPPPPAILLDRPVLLLHLQPPRRAPALVRAGLVFGDQALVAALDLLRPGVQTIKCKPPHRVDEARARDDIFEARPALVQWLLADIRSDPGSGPSSTGLTG